ncbi:MAG: hypothetical protein KKG59_02045, partial [Nanoarchaeota archaeon]|nr:hypothetical protein [Nanoarchaeota archaeon]
MGCPKEGKARKEYIERLSKLVSRKINGQPEGCKDFPNIGKMYYQNREHLEYIDEFSELFNEAIQDGR